MDNAPDSVFTRVDEPSRPAVREEQLVPSTVPCRNRPQAETRADQGSRELSPESTAPTSTYDKRSRYRTLSYPTRKVLTVRSGRRFGETEAEA